MMALSFYLPALRERGAIDADALAVVFLFVWLFCVAHAAVGLRPTHPGREKNARAHGRGSLSKRSRARDHPSISLSHA